MEGAIAELRLGHLTWIVRLPNIVIINDSSITYDQPLRMYGSILKDWIYWV